MTLLITQSKLRLVSDRKIQKENKEIRILEFANTQTYDKYVYFVQSQFINNLEVGKDYFLVIEVYSYRGQTRYNLVGVE